MAFQKMNAYCITRSLMAVRLSVLGSAALLLAIFARGLGATQPPAQVAAKVDQLLREEAPYANAAKKAPPRIDDERFLRRLSLDIIGRLPTPEEVTAFSLDPAADKRATIVTKR